MKRIVLYILTSLACLGIWQSCIDDESVGVIRELSLIHIEAAQDTFYVDFGLDSKIEASITQSGEGNMTYEWSWGAVNDAGKIVDSLQVISKDPVLHYAFRKLGQFKVRLRVTNEDGSGFYYFHLFVRTPFQEGLLVLSENENHVGRTSFLRTKGPQDVVTGEEEFMLNACEEVNPEIVLNHPRDVSWYKQKLLVISDGGKVIHEYDKVTFDYLNSIRVDQEYSEASLRAFVLVENSPVYKSLAWGGDKKIWSIDYELGLVTPNTGSFTEEKYDKVYFQGGRNALFVNFEESYLNHVFSVSFPNQRFSSDEIFKGQYIVNFMADEGNRLHVITTDPENPLSVTITYFDDMTARAGLFNYKGAFQNPKTSSYLATQPITLTRETVMLTNNTYYLTFYAEGNKLYEWIYKGFTLPETPLMTLDGEITCMQLSSDEKYVYLGIWNPGAEEELKGIIYILEMDTKKIVREYRGVADKPLKIFYKKDS